MRTMIIDSHPTYHLLVVREPLTPAKLQTITPPVRKAQSKCVDHLEESAPLGVDLWRLMLS
jgi:hypothetical protein